MKYVQQKVNKSIYAKGMPLDVTLEECIAFFSRAGVIKKDPDTAKEVIKLYTDEEGKPKGDALITFFRPESVQQAFALLHEAFIRPGFKVLIEEAKFKLEPGTSVRQAADDEESGSATNKRNPRTRILAMKPPPVAMKTRMETTKSMERTLVINPRQMERTTLRLLMERTHPNRSAKKLTQETTRT